MTIDEIMEKWALSEIDLEKARVLLKAEKEKILYLIAEYEKLLDPKIKWDEPGFLGKEEFIQTSVMFEKQKLELEQLEKFLEKIESMPENNKCFFLDLLKTDSPFTHKAIVKGLETGRIEITHEGKLNFKAMTKGSLVHIFKEGGYTEWGRVKENVLLKGQEVKKELKDLAAKEPPKEFERIEKELYKI